MPCMRGTDAVVLHSQVAHRLNNNMTRVATHYFLVLGLSCVQLCGFVFVVPCPASCNKCVYYVNILPLTAMPTTTTSAEHESDSEDLDYVPEGENHGMTSFPNVILGCSTQPRV